MSSPLLASPIPTRNHDPVAAADPFAGLRRLGEEALESPQAERPMRGANRSDASSSRPVPASPAGGLGPVLKLIIGALVGLAVIQIAVLSLLEPALQVRNIVVHSDLPLAATELRSMAGLDGAVSLLGLRPESVEERLLGFSFVQDATVERRLPDTLHLTVRARQPVALLLPATAGFTELAGVDADAVVFPVIQAAAGQQLPVLSGLRFTGAVDGARLPEFMHPLVSDLARLQEETPDLLRLISELEIQRRDVAGLEVLMYPVHSRVAVRLPDRLDADILRYAFLMLEMVQDRPDAALVREIDFRTGEVVFAPVSPDAR